MTLWKLTDKDGRTYGGMQWGEGIEHTAPGGGLLCTAAWIHAYTDPLLTMFLDPIGANFGPTARLWEAEGDVGAEDHGLKVGCTRLRTLREVPLPQITLEQRARFGVLCARAVYQDPTWNAWANDWLSGKDRSEAAAEQSALSAAASEAAKAKRATAAAWAAEEQSAASVAWAAAKAAAWAVAAKATTPLDLPALAQKAIEVT